MMIDDDNKEIDLHRIILPYAHTRVQREAELVRLSRSIGQYGQIMPVLVIAGEDNQFVLIDGYLRVQAIRICGRDTVRVRILKTKEPDAVLFILNKVDERRWDAVEQASMISELVSRFDMSLADIAKRMGKDKSWVKRRLDLIRALPEDVLKVVQTGQVSSWVASRILVPLARANASHAGQLTKHLLNEPMSARELSDFYDHYKKSNRSVRDKMINNPGLFLKASKSKQQAREAETIRKGPEGSWIKDINIISNILRRLNEQVHVVFYPGQPESEQKELAAAFNQACALFERLHKELNHDDRRTNPTDH